MSTFQGGFQEVCIKGIRTCDIEMFDDPFFLNSSCNQVLILKSQYSQHGLDPEEVTPENVAYLYTYWKKQGGMTKEKVNKELIPETKYHNKDKINESRLKIEVYGYPVTAIFRWMGNQGWTVNQVIRAIQEMDILGKVSNNTINRHYYAGKKGNNCYGKGKVPVLTEEQINELRKFGGII